MEVVSFKLYQRKLIFDGLSAMFYNGRGREREWDWPGMCGCVGLCVCVGGGGGGGGGEKGGRQTDTERVAFTIFLFFNCFAGDCS